MNKKLLTVGGTLVLGGLLLGATAYAAISANTGYDAYKAALKNTIAVKSVTPKLELTVKDNGSMLADVSSTIKFDKQNKVMSSTVSVTSGNEQKTFDVYKNADKTIFKSSDSDVYNVMTIDRSKFHRAGKPERAKQHDPAKNKDVENVFDAVALTLENYTSLTDNADGSKDVTFKLSENQVSPVLNAVASLAVKNFERENQFKHRENTPLGMENVISDLKNKLPKLTSDIKIKNIDVEAKISKDNLIESQSENIVITGKDDSGKDHEVTVVVETNFTDYNNTKPDTIDLAGKKVNEIKPQDKGFGRGHFEE